jgi:arylsulfatase A-like enzyme
MAIRVFTKFHLAVILLLIVTAAGVWVLSPHDSIRRIRHILLISIDTCRSDYLSCYGYQHQTTPNIDAVAEEGIIFENTISPVPETLPAHGSMLTGTTPLYHGIHENLGYQLGPSSVTLAEIVREHGYITGAIVGSFILDSQFGLDQGFDTYNDRFEEVITSSNASERRGGEVSIFAARWLEEHKNDKFFLFLHYFDPHFRYEPPQPYASQFADNLYAGEVAYVDQCIGQVINKLKQLGLYDKTLIIITSDHGEMLGEHGEAEHGFFIYQSAIKVPLVFKLPGRNKTQRVISTVGLVDIVPTVCSLLNIHRPKHIEGKDISEYFSDEKTSGRKRSIFCESLTPTKHNANALLGVVTDRWKYIQTTRPELYDLNKDLGEKNNLVNEEPQRAHLLREHLKLILKEQSHKGVSDSEFQLDEQGRKRLESLGYIASVQVDESLAFDQSKPDPKDVIKFHNVKAYNKMATSLAEQGKLKDAAEAFRKLIDHYENVQIKHGMATIRFNLATVLKRLGENEEAIQQFTKAIELYYAELEGKPHSAPLIYTRLGESFASMGNFKAASEAFKQALVLDHSDPANYNNLAASLEYEGRFDEAITVLQKGVEHMLSQGDNESATRLQERIEHLRLKQSHGRK